MMDNGLAKKAAIADRPVRPSSSPASCAQSSIQIDRVSAGSLAGLLSGRPCDPRKYRALYPDRWSAFLRAHFQNATHVAAFFEIDHKTARNWVEGATGPTGWAVAYVIHSIPSARQFLEAA